MCVCVCVRVSACVYVCVTYLYVFACDCFVRLPARSRLGCQITLDTYMDGIIVHIPDGPPIDIP